MKNLRIWSRRALLLAFVALTACGGGTSIESALRPARFISFGTGFSDLGQGGTKYTVNDGSINIWTEQLAASYGLTITRAALGGKSYARGNVRVLAKPDAAGDPATPTVKEQVDTFLGSDTLASNDVVLIEGGVSDIIAEVQAVILGTSTTAVALANVAQAGRDLGAQVSRLVAAGAKYVIVVGTYNLGRSPWAIQTAQGSLMLSASSRFNDEMLISIAGLGANVLYVDAALHYNLVTASPSAYGMVDSVTVGCTSVDPGPGIGTGPAEVNSALCTPATVVTATYNAYVFADRVYFTPLAQRSFGDYAASRLRARF